MIEAVWYGLIAALTFVGIVASVCLAVLTVFKPKGFGRYIIFISDDMDSEEIRRQIYGGYLKNLIFGDLIFDGINIVCGLMNEEKMLYVHDTALEYGITVQYSNEISDTGSGEEKNGSGAC